MNTNGERLREGKVNKKGTIEGKATQGRERVKVEQGYKRERYKGKGYKREKGIRGKRYKWEGYKKRDIKN